MEQKTLDDTLKVLLAQRAKSALTRYIESVTPTPAGKYLNITKGFVDTDTMKIEFTFEYVDLNATDDDSKC